MNGQDLTGILMTFVLLSLLFYLNREIEVWRLVHEIELYLNAYRLSKEKALDRTLKTFREVIGRGGHKVEESLLEDRVNNLIEVTLIDPVSLDPFGIVSKLKHILTTAEDTLRSEVRMLAPGASRPELENLLSLVEATRSLNYIYKAVDHLYRIGRRFKSLWILLQLSAQLPFVTELVKALEGSVDAFSKGWPIGDGVGALVASRLIRKHDGKPFRVAENTIVSRVEVDGREVVVVKAEGPGGTTGRLDDALRWVLESYEGPFSMIITVDAALKLEGEESGTIAEGFGVAMGGTGVERFNIEKLATEKGIPLYAVLIKMSESEALSVMTRKLLEAADRAEERVLRVIRERSKAGDRVVVVGVGNTIGIYP